MFKRNTDKSVAMSVPKAKTLHGVQIKKLPIGRYIRLFQHAGSFLPDILTALFPDGNISFPKLTIDGALGFLTRLVEVVPEKLCEVADELLDIPASMLLDPDEGLSPAELAEIFVALWEANGTSDFFTNVRRLASLIGASAPNIGSSAG